MGCLEVSINGGIQTIMFNRPQKKNALNSEIYKNVIASLDSAAKDQSVAVSVLTGKGEFYSSGNDFTPELIEDPEAFVEEATALVEKFVDALIDYPKLLIAVVNGPAIGIAATTLGLCDVVYASDTAWFRTPFSQLGLVPEGCSSFIFPRIMGPPRASRLLYLNETLTVDEALTSGLVTRVFPQSRLAGDTFLLIQEFAKLPSEAVRLSKQLVRGWDRDLLHTVNHKECKVLKNRFTSEDFYNTLAVMFSKQRSKL